MPLLGEDELQAVKEAFDRSWIGLGPKVNEFEDAWRNHLGSREAIALNSATAALHLALSVFRFPAGKKVLVPSLTFAATASAVLYNQLVPVFVDSNPLTLGMDMEDLEKKVDKDCVAVMPVHYAGHPVQMEELVSWAGKHNLKVIEDCAHTSGARYEGKPLGLWGDIGCFSFEEKKLMTTGDGGMMCSDDIGLLSDVRARRWVGIDRDSWKSHQSYTAVNNDSRHWFYEINILGYKYNMNDLAASIGLVQLTKLKEMNARRAEIVARYMNGIANLNDIELLLPFDPGRYDYHFFGIRTDCRDEMIVHLKSEGIPTSCHYTPLSQQPLFKEWGLNCPYIESEFNRMLSLPLHPSLSDDEVDYVIDAIVSFGQRH